MALKWSRIAISFIISTTGVSALADPPILQTVEAIQRTNVTKADVIIIGDTNHELSTIRDAVAQSLPAFKQSNPSIDCLFIEADARMQPAFDEYARSKRPDYKGTIMQASEDQLSPLERSGAVKTNAATAFTESLLKAARSSSIRVIAGDIDFSSDLGDRIQAVSMVMSLGVSDEKTQKTAAQLIIDDRSQLFAQKITESKKSGLCHASIVLIGIGHMIKTFGDVPVVKIQDRVKASGLTISTLAAISGSCKTDKNPDKQKKLICSELASGKSFSALIVDRSADDDPLFAIIGK